MIYRTSKISTIGKNSVSPCMNPEKRRRGKIVPNHSNVDDLTCGICYTVALKKCTICKRNLCMSCTRGKEYCAYCLENETALSVIEAINHNTNHNKPTKCFGYIYKILKS